MRPPATAERAGSTRFAVVIRTYQWDAFIARQVQRYAAVAAGGDLFVSLDETRGTLGPIDHPNLFSTTDAGLIAMGLADRFATGSLVWWNNDYPQYAFHQAHPDYDYYVFVEYDSLIRVPIAPLIARIAAQQLDCVAAPIAAPLRDWFWWHRSRRAYTDAELRASLNCICVLSNRALEMLLRRRRAMAADPAVRHWPISEAFVATEIVRAGYRFAPLAGFGDDSAYDWAPPLLEQELDTLGDAVFVHPVLDAARYVPALLKQGRTWRDYFDQRSVIREKLIKVPAESYAALLAPAAWRRWRQRKREWLDRNLCRAGLAKGW